MSLANQSLSPKNNPMTLTNQTPACHTPTSSAQSETGAQGLLANPNPGVIRPKGRRPAGSTGVLALPEPCHGAPRACPGWGSRASGSRAPGTGALGTGALGSGVPSFPLHLPGPGWASTSAPGLWHLPALPRNPPTTLATGEACAFQAHPLFSFPWFSKPGQSEVSHGFPSHICCTVVEEDGLRRLARGWDRARGYKLGSRGSFTHKSHLFPSLQTPQTLFPGIKPTFCVSSLAPVTVCQLFFRGKTKTTPVNVLLPQMMMAAGQFSAGWWALHSLSCSACLLNMQLDFHT